MPAQDDGRLPAFCRARVLILGVGNLLFGDDGYGPAVADYLSEHYLIPDDVYVMDVGTGVRRILFTLSLGETQPEQIVVVDAIDWGQADGQILELSADDLPANKTDDFSLHQVPTSNLLRELQERCGVRVTVYACDVGRIPQLIQPGLSPQTWEAVLNTSRDIAERFLMEGKPVLCTSSYD